MKKFFKRALIVVLIIITAVIITGYFTQASEAQQEWCKEKLEIIAYSYTGAFKDKLTQEQIDEFGGWLDTYFEAYRETFGQDWNSHIVIWQMFVPEGLEFDDISWQLANEAVENYNRTYNRNFQIDNPDAEVGEYIADTFMMQEFLLTYTGKTNPLKLCKAWEELN